MQYNIIFYLFLVVFWKHLVKIIIYSAPVFHNHKPQARYTVFTVKIFVFESLPPQLIFCYPASHLLMLHLGMLQERNQTPYCIHGNINGLVGQTVKNLPAKWETQVWPLGQVDPLEKGIAIHSSILAWRIPRTEEPGGPQSIGSQRLKHNWVINTLTFYLSSSSYGSGTQHLHSSVQFSSSVVSDSLRPHGLQHTRLPCPLPTPETCSNSCPSNQWCHPTISSSVVPFSSCLQSCPASRSFLMSQFFASGGQSFSFSISPSMNIQDWFPLGLTGLISLHFKGLSRVFSDTAIQKHQGDNVQPWRIPFPIWNQSAVPCPVLTVASWPAYKFLRGRSGGLVFLSLSEFSTVYCDTHSQRLWHSQ